MLLATKGLLLHAEVMLLTPKAMPLERVSLTMLKTEKNLPMLS